MSNTDAFITELKALLKKYNAAIYFDCHPDSDMHGVTGEYMSFCLNDNEEHKITDGTGFDASDISVFVGDENEHKICIIGTSYIPPYDNPTGIQFPYPPRESYNFAIHRSNGRKYVGGSVGPSVDGSDSANQTKAVRSAIFVAKKDGYTHYRLKGTDEIYPLDSE